MQSYYNQYSNDACTTAAGVQLANSFIKVTKP